MLGLDLGADESDDGEEFAPTGGGLGAILGIKEGVTREATTRRYNIGLQRGLAKSSQLPK